MALLYHCFPRRRTERPANKDGMRAGPLQTDWEQGKAILEGIIDHGIFLTEEVVRIPWDDPFGNHKSADTTVIQHRFCLTSLTDDNDLRGHCAVFGNLGIGFALDDIRQLGGFPVFYLPSPSGKKAKSCDHLDYSGVSLLYRLAEIRSVLDGVDTLPPIIKRQLLARVWDFENMMGALRFLGNMLYFTDYLKEHDSAELRYYKQREWRIIAGMGKSKAITEEIQFNQKTAHALRSLGEQPIRDLVQEVVLCGTDAQKLELEELVRRRHLNIPVRLIPPA